MNRLTGLLLLVAVMGVAVFVPGGDLTFAAAKPTLAFGFLLLAAYLVGDGLSRFGLPGITGYILTGILIGPYVLGLVDKETVSDLKLIDDLALTFIALAAGGELRIAELRERKRAIALTVLLQTALIFFGVGLVVLGAKPLFSFLAGRPLVEVLVVAALLGTFSAARSPSSAIAIITECRARGPFTDLVLGVTVVMDVLVIVVFAAVVSVGQALIVPGAELEIAFLLTVLVEILGSLVAGVLLGFLISLYIERIAADRALFILAVGFLVTFVSREFAHFLDRSFAVSFHLEPMLICLTAGFLVVNFSKSGEVFLEKIDRSSLPIYVVFFSLTGASLDITTLQDTWLIALLLVVARAALIWGGGYAGGLLAGDRPVFRRASGFAFLTQAGVSLGLAGIVARRFPEWGTPLATTIVAVITINQVIGPVALKRSLVAAGEDRSATTPVPDPGTG